MYRGSVWFQILTEAPLREVGGGRGWRQLFPEQLERNRQNKGLFFCLTALRQNLMRNLLEDVWNCFMVLNNCWSYAGFVFWSVFIFLSYQFWPLLSIEFQGLLTVTVKPVLQLIPSKSFSAFLQFHPLLEVFVCSYVIIFLKRALRLFSPWQSCSLCLYIFDSLSCLSEPPCHFFLCFHFISCLLSDSFFSPQVSGRWRKRQDGTLWICLCCPFKAALYSSVHWRYCT